MVSVGGTIPLPAFLTVTGSSVSRQGIAFIVCSSNYELGGETYRELTSTGVSSQGNCVHALCWLHERSL